MPPVRPIPALNAEETAPATMYLPSRDQSVASWKGESPSTSSWPVWLAFLTNMLFPFLATELKMMRAPSGDQMGHRALPPKVKREAVPRARSWSHRSETPDWGSRRSVATVVPSGEREAHSMLPGGPTVPEGLPERSNQVICTPPFATAAM